MAALTWRDVAAPNFQGVQQGINGAAELLSKSTTGLSGALTQFGDQQALQQLAKYSDAQKLQADIQSGRFNTANASPEALAAMMNRPAALLTNAANQQTFDFNAQKNPLELTRQEISNTTSQEALDQSQRTNPLVVNALQRADAVGAKGQANRLAEIDQQTLLNNVQYPAAVKQAQYSSDLANLTQPQSLLATARTNAETNRAYPIQESTRQAQEQVAMLQSQGQLPSPVEGNAYFQQLVDSGAHPVVLNAVKGMLEQSFGKGVIGAVSTSVGGSVGPAQLLNNAAGTAGTSVGERNNNQGNLMGTGWVTSMPGYLGNDDKGFAKFASNEQGTAANNRQLERYWEGTQATGGKPVRTIDGIINTWAPVATASAATGNSAESVANYKKYVQTRTGIDMTKELTKEQLGPVRAAMQEFETGNVSGASASTSLTQAAKPLGTSTTPAPGESTDVFALKRKFQTLSQQVGAVGAQDATNFNADVLGSLNTPMDMAGAFTELRKDPAFANIHESTIVDALNKAQQVSGLSTFAPLVKAVRMSLSSNTEFNTTKGAPWFTGTFDSKKLEQYAKQAGNLPEAIKSAEGAAKRKDDLAQVSFLMPQIEALNNERINLYQQKQLGKPGADAALAKVDERLQGYMSIVNPLISGLDSKLATTVKNSPQTDKELTDTTNKKIAEDAAKKANETALLNKAKAAEKRAEETRIAFANAPPEVRKAAAAGQLIKDAADKKKAATLLAQKQKDQATLQGLEWLTPETAVYVDPKLASLILDDPEKERLLGRHITRILQNRLKN